MKFAGFSKWLVCASPMAAWPAAVGDVKLRDGIFLLAVCKVMKKKGCGLE